MTSTEQPRQTPSIADSIGEALDRQHSAVVVRATVTANDGDQVEVRRPGFSNADGQSYPKLDGVAVVADDEVLMFDVTGVGGWIVLGKIVRN